MEQDNPLVLHQMERLMLEKNHENLRVSRSGQYLPPELLTGSAIERRPTASEHQHPLEALPPDLQDLVMDEEVRASPSPSHSDGSSPSPLPPRGSF